MLICIPRVIRKNKVEETNKYNEILASWKVPEVKTAEESWEALQSKIQKSSAPAVKVIPLWKKALAFGAAAAVIVALLLAFPSDGEVKVVADNEQQEVILPDGSKVILNVKSSVAYNQSWENRVINLDGEAFFEVTKGQKFTVNTENGSVNVLGTSFNVYDEEGIFMVDCYSGIVQVKLGDDQEILTKGMATKMRGEELLTFAHSKEECLWLEGDQFYYENTKLSKVFNDFERRFKVEIEFIENDESVTANFATLDLNEALTIVCKPRGLNFSIKGNMVRVYK